MGTCRKKAPLYILLAPPWDEVSCCVLERCQNLGGAIIRTCDVCEAHPVKDVHVACVGVQGRSHVRLCVLASLTYKSTV